MDHASRPAVNLNIASTCADGHIGDIEMKIGRAFGALDDADAEQHLRQLAKTRPLAAIVHCQREIVSRGADKDAAALIAVRSDLVHSYSQANSVSAVVAMALCVSSSPAGTVAALEASDQLKHGLVALARTTPDGSRSPALPWKLIRRFDNDVAKAIEKPRQNAIVLKQSGTMEPHDAMFLALAPSQPIDQSMLNAARVNEVLAVFLGQEDGLQHAKARRILNARPQSDLAVVLGTTRAAAGVPPSPL